MPQLRDACFQLLYSPELPKQTVKTDRSVEFVAFDLLRRGTPREKSGFVATHRDGSYAHLNSGLFFDRSSPVTLLSIAL